MRRARAEEGKPPRRNEHTAFSSGREAKARGLSPEGSKRQRVEGYHV
ncbi:MAG TPA: hypothetical protein GX704_05445 [Clostridiales bacterium]|nr:hypothetical protein [Clostridiales bacterium]